MFDTSPAYVKPDAARCERPLRRDQIQPAQSGLETLFGWLVRAGEHADPSRKV